MVVDSLAVAIVGSGTGVVADSLVEEIVGSLVEVVVGSLAEVIVDNLAAEWAPTVVDERMEKVGAAGRMEGKMKMISLKYDYVKDLTLLRK